MDQLNFSIQTANFGKDVASSCSFLTLTLRLDVTSESEVEEVIAETVRGLDESIVLSTVQV